MILTQNPIKLKPTIPPQLHCGISVLKSFDCSAIAGIISASFGKKLVPGYFESPIKAVIVDDNQKGVAIVKELEGEHYLDKFAVKKEYQSNGVGRNIWATLVENFSEFSWRAKIDNPINPWYLKKCDGHEQKGDWLVFWVGKKPDVEKIALLPETLIPQ